MTLEILPAGWAQKPLGQISKPGYGKALDSTLRKPSGNFPVVGSAGVMAFTDSPLVGPGTLVVGRKGNIGQVHLLEKGGWPIDTVYFLKVPPTFDSRYLALVLESLELRRFNSSTTTPSLRREDLEAVLVPVCSLEEQERIVEILEEQLSRLDAAVKSVQTVREKAAQFRRSLLHAAFLGSDKTKWRTLPLEDLLEFSIGGVWGEGPGESEVDVEVVRVTELRSHGVVDVSTAVRRSITQKQLDSRALKPGDLVLEKSGGGPNTPVGRVGKIVKIERTTVCSNFMQLMRPDVKTVRPSFLHHFLVYFHSDGKTIPLQTATTNIRNIKTKDYLKTRIPVPSLDEQDEIVQILEEQLSRLDATLAVADEVERKTKALRRSLLHAAFTGELTRSWRESHV